MKKILTIVCLLFVLFSCNKEKLADKKLNGNWKVNLVRIEDGEGFAFYDSIPTGNLDFSTTDRKFSGQINYKYTDFEGNVIVDTCKYLNANFNYINKKAESISVIQNNDTVNMRLVILTKTALELEYYDLNKYRMIRFILYK